MRLDSALDEAGRLQPVPVSLDAAAQFLTRRLEQQLVDEGQPVDRVRAVLVHAMRPRLVDQLLGQLATLVGRPRFVSLAGALQRVRRIVPPGTLAGGDAALLAEDAERRLLETVSTVGAELDGRVDLVRFTRTAAALAQPIARFFDEVLVMSEDPALRAARLGLLATVRDLAQAQLDWSELRL